MTAEKMVAEILGTMILILLGDGVVAGVLLKGTKANNSGWIVITWAWGMAVFAGIAVAGTFSGAHMNPAVTLGVWIQSLLAGGSFGVDQLIGYWIGEFIGAFIGATLVFLHYYPHWAGTEDQGLKLAVFCTAPAIRNPVWNLVSEIIGTFVLLFVGFSLGNAAGVNESIGGALGWGLLVLVIGLGLGGTTGYAINPARDLGPRIMHAILPIPGKGGSDWEYSWIPVVGPLIGGALGALLYYYAITSFVA
ncbi:MAG: aquaporin family protein [Chloroflexi bacterium]|jgi:glycerol uptake facilitator protein|nr:aquaporin family protein [Chloroflexota bacterium]